MKKIIYGGIAILMIMSLIGCGKKRNYSEASAKSLIEMALNQKYQKEFNVEVLRKENIGQNFSHYVYYAEVSSETGIFEVSMEVDGSGLKDNYLKLLYGEQLEREAKDILYSADSFRVKLIGLDYPQMAEEFENYEDYKANGNITVDAEIEIYEDSAQLAAEESYELLEQLTEAGFCYTLKLSYQGKIIYESYIEYLDMKPVTREKLIQRFEGL